MSTVAALLLFLLPFCLTGEALLRNRVFGPIDFPYATEPLLPLRGQYGISPAFNGILSDVACQMIPWRKAVQWSLAHGEWPIHNPFTLSGDILAAAAQAAAYSPFTLIACLLPVAESLTYSAAITFFIAGLGAFLFARELGCREAAALIASGAWMYSTDVSFFVLWPLAVSWTFLPLVLLGVRRVVRSPGSKSLSLLTTAFTLLLLAGHPETAAHVVLIGCAYAVLEVALHRPNLWRAVAAGFGAGVLSVLICAVYILPILDAAPQTEEYVTRREIFARSLRGVNTAEVLARLATDIFPFLHVRHWKVSGLEPLPFDTAAVGSIALALATYAVWRARSPESWFFAGTAVFCLLARAEWTPVARTLQRVPLFDVMLNERLSFGAAFAIALLAAIGVEDLLRRERPLAAAVTTALVLIVLTAGTLLLIHANVVKGNGERWGEYKVFAEIAGLAGVTALLVAHLPPQWTVAGILGLLLLQRTMSERGAYMTFPTDAAYPPIEIFEPLKNVHEPFRVIGLNLTLIPATSTLYELEDPRGYEAMTFRPYATTDPLWSAPQPVWFNRVLDLGRPFLSFLNVRFAVVWSRYQPPPGWRVFATQRGAKLLEKTDVIDRAFVPGKVILGLSEADVLAAMRKATDFREQAWITVPVPPGERSSGPGHVTTYRRPFGYDLIADMEHDGWIVVSETAWRGWRAYIDGRRVQTQNANIAFLSVYVPRGHHRVKLSFLPESFVTGRAISIATLIGIALYVVVRKSVHAHRLRLQ